MGDKIKGIQKHSLGYDENLRIISIFIQEEKEYHWNRRWDACGENDWWAKFIQVSSSDERIEKNPSGSQPRQSKFWDRDEIGGR